MKIPDADDLFTVAGRMGKRISTRDQDAASLILELLPSIAPISPVLIVDDDTHAIEQAIKRQNSACQLVSWQRKVTASHAAQVWVPEQTFAVVFLRLPISRATFEMLLHATVSRLTPQGKVFIYGANDEGIKSTVKLLAQFFDQVETILIKKRCRVIEAISFKQIPLKTQLLDWQETLRLATPVGEQTVCSYPSLFAHGKLDPGTELLLTALPVNLEGNAHVLDFACGTGIIALALKKKFPTIALDLIDNDAMASVVAKINVPNAEIYLASNLNCVAHKKYDLIISNPPIHKGKEEDFSVLVDLIQKSTKLLQANGALLFVVQATVPVKRRLFEYFSRVELVKHNSQYAIWQCAQN
ncbi:MAG: class I SAM-dependent methyltransferase [Candidatus Abawacabacteria bacterium]|nr:class I SAM-dependent methyltransferase [Candidatus Abawacabacteria bacterium]